MKHYCNFIYILILFAAVSCTNPVGSQISLDEESILFIRSSNDFRELAAMRPDGTLIKVILRYDDNSKYFPDRIDAARWSPDKSRIVLEGGPTESREYTPLWIIDNNGKFIRKLTRNGFKPVWSNDGKKIFFMRRRGFFSLISDVYSVNSDGTGEELVYMAGDSISFHLTDVSDTGKYLLGYESFFYFLENGVFAQSDFEIVRINLLSGEKAFFTDNELADTAPRLSNDGIKIAYYHREFEGNLSFERITNIYVMNSEGNNPQQITYQASFNVSLPYITWSPHADFLGYHKSDQKNHYNEFSDIFIVEISSGMVNQLTNTAKNNIINTIMDWK